MAGMRRKARIAALQALYELDCTKHKAEEALAHLTIEEKLPQEALSFSEELVRGVLQHKSEIDALIKKSASTFPANCINETIELAKEFGSDSSPRLVNGVLGAITTERGLG